MNSSDLNELKYPIGKFKMPETIEKEQMIQWVDIIDTFPKSLTKLVVKLSEQELNYRYRPGGWTIRQLIHHCADSHMNSFIRFKLALTEDSPVIKPYDEASWAELPDGKYPVFQASLNIIYGLHQRWANLLTNLSEKDLQKTFTNPESNRTFTLGQATALYAWHCKHHLAHIKMAKTTKDKY